jgi:hypothetical protein
MHKLSFELWDTDAQALGRLRPITGRLHVRREWMCTLGFNATHFHQRFGDLIPSRSGDQKATLVKGVKVWVDYASDRIVPVPGIATEADFRNSSGERQLVLHLLTHTFAPLADTLPLRVGDIPLWG